MKREIGTVVVGYGWGDYHCQQIRETEGLRLAGICDAELVRRNEAGKKYGVKTYATIEEVLDDSSVEMVVLVTPHHTHAPLALQALAAGRHVVVEKAMCLNLKEADAMIEAARKAKRTLTVHQNRRYDGDYMTACQIIQSGVLGEVYQIETACNYWGPHLGWRTKAHFGGGYLYDAGGHMIDQLAQMAGCRAKTVFADLQKRVWTDTMDTETYALVTVRFENGLMGLVDVSGIAWYRKPRFVIMGEKGTFVAMADENFGQATGFIYASVADSKAKIELGKSKESKWMLFYQQLADHLLNNSELSVKPEEARESIKIIEAVFRSAETGQSVEILNW